MFWDPGVYPHVLQLHAFSGGSIPGARQSNLSKIAGLRRFLKTPDGRSHLLYNCGDHVLQLRIHGADVTKPVQLLTEAVTAPELQKARLLGLATLNQLWHGGADPCRPPSTLPNSDRLHFVLRALDGCLAGASYREIAIVLFGATRVRDDWNDGTGHLKNRIRRAVQRGRILVAGRYRCLLANRLTSRDPGIF